MAKAIDLAHDDNTRILSYNDENSLACVLSIAYIWAKNELVDYNAEPLGAWASAYNHGRDGRSLQPYRS